MMRTYPWFVVVLLFLCALTRPAAAETVVEGWRSPFGTPWSVSVNPTDGSCWVADSFHDLVVHPTADTATTDDGESTTEEE